MPAAVRIEQLMVTGGEAMPRVTTAETRRLDTAGGRSRLLLTEESWEERLDG